MPVTATTSQEIFIGAGDVYVDDAVVGATMDNNLFRVVREYYTPDLNGVPGPLIGLDYVQSETAELEVTIPEISPARLALAVPGSISTATDNAGTAAAGGGDTTLAADSAIGATNIKVAAVTNIAIGDLLQIGATGAREFRKATTVGTGGAGGTGIDLDGALTSAHVTAQAVTEVNSTTLAADVAAQATNIKVASVTGFANGDYVRFGHAGEEEVRAILVVGTAGAGGSGLTLQVPASRSHRSGDAAWEVSSEGGALIRSDSGVNRRLPSSAYHKWQLRIPGLDGREARFTLTKAIMNDNAEFEAADDGTLAPRLTLQARWDPAASTTSPWSIERIAATT